MTGAQKKTVLWGCILVAAVTFAVVKAGQKMWSIFGPAKKSVESTGVTVATAPVSPVIEAAPAVAAVGGGTVITPTNQLEATYFGWPGELGNWGEGKVSVGRGKQEFRVEKLAMAYHSVKRGWEVWSTQGYYGKQVDTYKGLVVALERQGESYKILLQDRQGVYLLWVVPDYNPPRVVDPAAEIQVDGIEKRKTEEKRIVENTTPQENRPPVEPNWSLIGNGVSPSRNSRRGR